MLVSHIRLALYAQLCAEAYRKQINCVITSNNVNKNIRAVVRVFSLVPKGGSLYLLPKNYSTPP